MQQAKLFKDGDPDNFSLFLSETKDELETKVAAWLDSNFVSNEIESNGRKPSVSFTEAVFVESSLVTIFYDGDYQGWIVDNEGENVIFMSREYQKARSTFINTLLRSNVPA